MLLRVMGRANAAVLLVLVLGILMTTINVFQLQRMQREYFQSSSGYNTQEGSLSRPKYVVYGKNIDSGYLKHVYAVLER